MSMAICHELRFEIVIVHSIIHEHVSILIIPNESKYLLDRVQVVLLAWLR